MFVVRAESPGTYRKGLIVTHGHEVRTEYMPVIDISGLDHVEVFRELYRAAIPRKRNLFNNSPPTLSRADAAPLLGKLQTTVQGRALFVQVGPGDEINPWTYNREHGQGTAQRAVDAVRAASARDGAA